MNEKLRAKIETIAERCADLIDMRIQAATKDELCDATVMTEINEGIRMLHHAVAALERINRMDKDWGCIMELEAGSVMNLQGN